MAEWMDEFRLLALDYDDPRFDWLKDKMNSTIATHNGRSFRRYHIENVFEVKNARLWDSYSKKRKDISRELGNRRVHERRLFHGTTRAEEIAEYGFDLRHADPNCMFGKGIYFSDLSSKCNQYTEEIRSQTCYRHSVQLCTRCTRSMLFCRVALGRQYYATEPMNGIYRPPKGFHSVVAKPKAGFLNYPEYVVYDTRQVTPVYLIEYKIRK